jgi:hypothetical protein
VSSSCKPLCAQANLSPHSSRLHNTTCQPVSCSTYNAADAEPAGGSGGLQNPLIPVPVVQHCDAIISGPDGAGAAASPNPAQEAVAGGVGRLVAYQLQAAAGRWAGTAVMSLHLLASIAGKSSPPLEGQVFLIASPPMHTHARTLMVMGLFVRSAGLAAAAATCQVLQAPPPCDLRKGLLARESLQCGGVVGGGDLVGRHAAGTALHS